MHLFYVLILGVFHDATNGEEPLLFSNRMFVLYKSIYDTPLHNDKIIKLQHIHIDTKAER